MIDYIPVDLSIHKSILIDLNDEYLSWIGEKIKKHYDLDVISILGQSIRDYAEKSVNELASYTPPKGIFYILQINNNTIGMGAFRKLKDDIGEVKRMYIRPDFRGHGYGKVLLKKLLNIGKRIGCTRIRLDTGLFMSAAQRVYRSAGFQEIEKYPETEVPLEMQPYWIYMEKKLID
ncbi:MAG: GNAT family N-acetyltransferase [Promethearchaeota archaeon]|nr:MAG: GNAT family N-acetyltransferase [Candidatus Lokiarchaeota archaeon]